MVRSVTNGRAAMARLESPLDGQCQHLALAFAFGELVEGVGPAFAGEEPGDDRRVDDCLPVCEAAEGVDKVRDVEDAFLERVADPFGMFLDQPHGVMRLDVLGEEERMSTPISGCSARICCAATRPSSV